MTKRKADPQKRGRKNLARGIREQVYLRLRAQFLDRKISEPKLTRRRFATDFIEQNREWLKSLGPKGILISDYPTLRNVLMAGLAERWARRRANWGIVTGLTGRSAGRSGF
jgi:hypothetical protein